MIQSSSLEGGPGGVRMSALDFLGNLIARPVCDLLAADNPAAPRTPGAYILLARSGVTFRYPGGESPVFYIGKAERLRRRLLTHRRNIRAAGERKLSLHRPVREYGHAF